MRKKTQSTEHLLIHKKGLCNLKKFTSKLDTEQAENTKNSERQKN